MTTVQNRPVRIALGGIWHETNAFASTTTTVRDFEIHEGDALLKAFKGTRTPLGGYIDWAADHDNVLLSPTYFAQAVPSGLVARESYESMARSLVDQIANVAPNIILLDLHGAMSVEGYSDVEADILQRLRTRLGQVPIGAVLDFHGNISAAFVHAIDILAGYDTYPHTDHYERGREVAELTLKTWRQQVKPARVIVKPPILMAPPAQYTSSAPMSKLMQQAFEAEKIPGVLTVTIAGGFPYSDVPHAGLSIIVTSDDNRELAQEIANEIAQQAWSMRHEMHVKSISAPAAVARAIKSTRIPVVLVDSADNIGGGAPGDGTVLLKELLASNAKGAVISIADPDALAHIKAAGLGADVCVQLGGKTDQYHGSPVEVRGRVVRISCADFNYCGSYMTSRRVIAGMAAVLDVQGLNVIVRERKVMPFDAEELRVLGIEPTRCRIIVVKSAIAWRAAYGEMAGEVIEVETPGICSSTLTHLPFKNLREDVFPLNASINWSAQHADRIESQPMTTRSSHEI
jgi:microcystin degradation protein MlrC